MLMKSLKEFFELGVYMYEAWIFRCSKVSVSSRGFEGWAWVVTGWGFRSWVPVSSVVIDRSNLGLAFWEGFLERSGMGMGSGSLMISFYPKFKFSKSYYLSHSTYTSIVAYPLIVLAPTCSHCTLVSVLAV
jgi:hypothetical protein